MRTLASERSDEPWRRRLFLPAYQVQDAARYAGVSSRTVTDWHKAGARKAVTLSHRAEREALSYMQLIEVAVVAEFRKAHLSLARIRAAREYVGKELKSEFPFAEYRFKTDGKRLFMDYEQVEGKKGKGKLLAVDRGGQFAWSVIIGRLKDFDYEGDLAVRWHVEGKQSPVVIDPKIAFGTPTVKGVPTWVLAGRWKAGESLGDIAYDFELKVPDVEKALTFEGIEPDKRRPGVWVN